MPTSPHIQSLQKRVTELEQLLYQSLSREEHERTAAAGLRGQLEQRWYDYPLFSNPRVRLLQKCLSSVMEALRNYQENPCTYSAAATIDLIQSALSELMKDPTKLREEELHFNHSYDRSRA